MKRYVSREIERTMHRAIWEERLTVAQAIARYGINRASAYYAADQLRKKHGDPPKCACGRTGLHQGQCVAQIDAAKYPRCPRCDGMTTKRGRAPRADDGTRAQLYGCRDCGHIFVGTRTRRIARLEDWEETIHRLVWISGDKQEYVAAVTGLSRTTVYRFVAALKAKYGPPKQSRRVAA